MPCETMDGKGTTQAALTTPTTQCFAYIPSSPGDGTRRRASSSICEKQRQGGFLISQIHHLGGRIFAQKLQQYGVEINPAQGRIMSVLWREDGIAINELSKKTSLAKSTLTSMLDRLEEAGYVVRERAEEDRRKILVRRTEKDKAWQGVCTQVSQEMTGLFYNGFTESEIDVFEERLRRILDNLIAAEARTTAPRLTVVDAASGHLVVCALV